MPLLPVLAAALVGFTLSSAGLLWGAAFAAFNAFTHPRVFFTTRGAKPKSHAAALVTVAAAFIAGVALLPDRANWLIFLVPPVASSFIAFQRAAKHTATERLYTGELRERILAEQPVCRVCREDKPSLLAVDHLQPFSKFGNTSYENAQVLCQTHNSQKGAKSNFMWRLKRTLTFATIRGK